jgi:electron transfer flavoprotein alpha/beta subunit
VTVSSEAGELRYISIRALQAVSKKPLQILNAMDLELDLKRLTHRTIFNLFAFHDERQCKFIEGESPQDKGENIAILMKNEGLI